MFTVDIIRPSRFLRFTRSVSISLLWVILVCLFIGLVKRDIFVLSFIAFILSPAFVLIGIIYRLTKTWQITNKTQKLADLLDKSADELEKDNSKLTLFDITTHSNTEFVWSGAVTPFLVATVRLFQQAKINIISEQSGRNKQWTTPIKQSPIMELSRQTKKIVLALRDSDQIGTFEAIGDLFVFALLFRKRIQAIKEREYPEHDFLRDLESISFLLKQRHFIKANDAVKHLIDNILSQSSPDPTRMRWQAILAYWLSIRLSLIEAPSTPPPSSFWLGPSKILSMQVDSISQAYTEQDYADITETIYESFDWRSKVPRAFAR
jgi:hypothetical protein